MDRGLDAVEPSPTEALSVLFGRPETLLSEAPRGIRHQPSARNGTLTGIPSEYQANL